MEDQVYTILKQSRWTKRFYQITTVCKIQAVQLEAGPLTQGCLHGAPRRTGRSLAPGHSRTPVLFSCTWFPFQALLMKYPIFLSFFLSYELRTREVLPAVGREGVLRCRVKTLVPALVFQNARLSPPGHKPLSQQGANVCCHSDLC